MSLNFSKFFHLIAAAIGQFVLMSGFLVLASLLVFFVIWRLNPDRKFNPKWASLMDWRREFVYWLVGGTFFYIVLFVFLYLTRDVQLSRQYESVSEYGEFYYWAGFIIVLFAYDFYFYVTHVLLHTRWLYRKIHYVHHLSRNTTALTAFSFHPVESAVHYGFPLLLTFVIPLHQSHILFLSWFMMAFDTVGHSGFDYWPRRLIKPPWIFGLNFPLHHLLHHENVKGNFSLYFNLWDSVFKTNQTDYVERVQAYTGHDASALDQ